MRRDEASIPWLRPQLLAASPLQTTPLAFRIGTPGRLESDVRAVSQETCRHKSPILGAGRPKERIPVVAADVQPIGSNVRHGRGLAYPLTN